VSVGCESQAADLVAMSVGCESQAADCIRGLCEPCSGCVGDRGVLSGLLSCVSRVLEALRRSVADS